MDPSTVLAALGALTGIGALVNSVLNRRDNKTNATAVTALEEGKLDLSVAVFGHDITMDLISELRAGIRDCHEERDQFRAMLVAQGVIPK